jgi:hypothetical protein
LDSLKKMFVEYVGGYLAIFYLLQDAVQIAIIRAMALVNPAAAGRTAAATLSPSLTPEARKKELEIIKASMSAEDAAKFQKAYDDAVGKGKGAKLSPFGMAEAGAASQMQQMAGGDIFGAVAFTPLEDIKTFTERTAEATEKIANYETPSKVMIEPVGER